METGDPLATRIVGKSYTYDDLGLVPAYSEVTPDQIDLSVTLPRGERLEIPILSAAMDTVSGAALVAALNREGGIGVLHRNQEVEEQVLELQRILNTSPPGWPIAAAVGVGSAGQWRAEHLIATGAIMLIVDAAHGHSLAVIDQTAWLCKTFPNITVVAGNVATATGARALADAGAHIIKLGVGGGCFAAGTRVLMADATYKNIEDIQAGDRVVNMDGAPVTVVRSWCTGERQTMAVRYATWATPARVTPDHRYWVGDLSTVSDKHIQEMGIPALLRRPDYWRQSKLRWKSIGDSQRDVVLAPRAMDFEIPEHFHFSPGDYAIHKGRFAARHNLDIKDSYELGYIFGTFLGDGDSFVVKNRNSQTGAVHWNFGAEEHEIAAKLIRAATTVIGVAPHPMNNRGQNIIKLVMHSLPWARLFKEFGKHTDKHLPASYLCKNPEYLRGLRDGLVDSDGDTEAHGRDCTNNTSLSIIELFGLVTFMLHGSWPRVTSRPPRAGGLRQCNIENCHTSYRSSLPTSHRQMWLDNYQIIRQLERGEIGPVEPVYDIEVDCPTHSFIANGAIVHNSICTTRVVAGIGVGMLTAIAAVAAAVDEYNVLICADGGMRYSGDIVKALAAGADLVMLGRMLAGCDEAPGERVEQDGQTLKEIRGMGSADAMAAGQANDRYGSNSAKKTAPEGVSGLIEPEGLLTNVIARIVGGVRAGFGYCGAPNIAQLQATAQFAEQSQATQIEGHPHNLLAWRT